MKNLVLSSFLVLFTLLFITSCGKDDNPNTFNCTSSFNLGQATVEEAEALSNAAVAYGNDPSPENCNRFKEAYRDYIDELKIYRDCAYERGQGVEYEESLQEAEEELENLC